MEARDVVAVLDALDRAGVDAAVGGGWGVDALLGRQTRPHRDLDLAVDAARLADAIAALTTIGLPVTLDQLPARLVCSDDRRAVDLHPVRRDADGTGRQQGFEGVVFVYPPGSTDATGWIGGRRVRCCSVALQVLFHEGYDPSDRDREDMAALAARFDLDLPPPYEGIRLGVRREPRLPRPG